MRSSFCSPSALFISWNRFLRAEKPQALAYIIGLKNGLLSAFGQCIAAITPSIAEHAIWLIPDGNPDL
jgi:hypothetical protein